jgi:hypothetical protein
MPFYLFSNRICTLVAPVMLFVSIARAQSMLSIATTQGKILKHSTKLNYDPPAYSYGIELQYLVQTSGKRYWQQAFGNPLVGLSLLTNQYQDSILGNTYALAPTIQFSLLRWRRLQLHTRLSAGPSIATRYWQRKNFADTFANYLGSALNMYGQVQVGIQFAPTDRVQCVAGIALNHVSNGAIRKPNLGVNLVGYHAAVRYAVSRPTTYMKLPKASRRKDTWGLDLRYAMAYAEYGDGNGPLLPFYYGALLGNYTLRDKHRLFFGVDYEYSTKQQYFLTLTNQDVRNVWSASSLWAAVMGNEFLLGKFSIPVQLGFYLNNRQWRSKTYYQKFGVMYYPFKYAQRSTGFYTGLSLKSSGSVADYIDVQVGYHTRL